MFVSGVLNIPSNNTMFNCFNYRKYLYNHKIYYILNANRIKIMKSNTSIFYDIKNRIISRIKRIDTKNALKVGNTNPFNFLFFILFTSLKFWLIKEKLYILLVIEIFQIII